jgi:pyruvate formate lyase activating enzyme
MHRDLPEFIAKVKDLGLSVKLDTNGTHPAMLESLLKKGWLDYIAMDIKAPWKKYSDVVGVKIDLEKLQQSVKIIMESGLPHEFRSTVLPRLHSRADIISMARQVRGARAYFLQQFRPVDNLVNDEFVTEKKYLMKDLEDIRREIKDWFKVCRVR